MDTVWGPTVPIPNIQGYARWDDCYCNRTCIGIVRTTFRKERGFSVLGRMSSKMRVDSHLLDVEEDDRHILAAERTPGKNLVG